MSRPALPVNTHVQWQHHMHADDERALLQLTVRRALTDNVRDTIGPGKLGTPYATLYGAVRKSGAPRGDTQEAFDYRQVAESAVSQAYDDKLLGVIPDFIKPTGKPRGLSRDYTRIYRAARRTCARLDWSRMELAPLFTTTLADEERMMQSLCPPRPPRPVFVRTTETHWWDEE